MNAPEGIFTAKGRAFRYVARPGGTYAVTDPDGHTVVARPSPSGDGSFIVPHRDLWTVKITIRDGRLVAPKGATP